MPLRGRIGKRNTKRRRQAMEKFEMPEVQVVNLEEADIITDSACPREI